MKTLKAMVETEVAPAMSGDLMHADHEKLNIEQRMDLYAAIQFELDKLAKRREVLNARLKEDVKQVGTVTEKGHYRFEVNGKVASVEKRVTKMPEEGALNALLVKNGLSLDDVSDTVTEKRINPSKIDYLIELGKLKAADVDALRKVTYALSVDTNEETAQLLAESAKPKAEPLTEEPKKPSKKKNKAA